MTMLNMKHTEKTKEKQRQSKLGKKNPMYKKVWNSLLD